MLSLPEWAPAVHPLIVHFPLALLFAAAAVDLAALLLPRWPWLRPAATGLYLMGAAGAVAAFFSGRSAADGVLLPAAADAVLSAHADWAARTAWFFAVYGGARLLRERLRPRRHVALDAVVVLIGMAGLPLLVSTGERGAQLVFQHGVGVRAAQGEARAHDHAAHDDGGVDDRGGEDHDGAAGHEDGAAADHNGSAGHRDDEAPNPDAGAAPAGGSWSWRAGAGTRGLLSGTAWLQGAADAVVAEPSTAADGTEAVVVEATAPVLVVRGAPRGDVTAELGVRLVSETSAVRLVHHVRDARTYDALRLEAGSIALERVRDGKPEVLSRADADLRSWRSVRLVVAGRHLRGYVDDRLLVHAHADPGPDGRVGLQLPATGGVAVARLRVGDAAAGR